MNTSKLRGYTTNNATDNVFDYVSGHDKRNFTSDSNAKGRNVMTGGADDALLKSRKVSSILPEGIPLEHSPDLPDSVSSNEKKYGYFFFFWDFQACFLTIDRIC